MYKKRIWFYSFLIVLTFSGCELFNLNNEKNGLSPQELQAQLVNKTWELRTVLEDGYGIYAPELDSMYTLQFSDDGQFSGHEICNDCGGEYHINDNSNLVIEGMACAEMACSGFQESVPFTNILVDQAHSIKIQDEQLTISVENDSMDQTYLFSEYGSLKEVIMARPQNTSDFDFSEWPNSNHFSIEAEVSGDSIHVDVGYSGCDIHELNLVAYNYFSGTEPAQAKAFVSHTAEGCRAALGASETFSLVPLKEAYQESISSSGSIQLIIGENGAETDTVLYRF